MKTFMNKTMVISALALAIAGCDSDTLPADNGNSFGKIDLSGAPQVGETLTVTVTDGNGVDEASINFSWMADDAVIAGAAGSTFVLTPDQAGTQISVTASYTDNDNYQELLKSKATSTIVMNALGMVAITGTTESGKLLTATITDDNGFSPENIAYAWMADGTAIDGATEATYALTDNEIGKTITVMVTYTDDDGFTEELTSEPTEVIEPAGTNAPATFDGDLTAKIFNTAADPVTGNIVVTDGDVGEDVIEVQTDAITTFGTFSIAENGDWSYLLDIANPTIASLVDDSDMVTDTISFSSVDGTTGDLVITISGPQVIAPTKVAKITDSMTDDAGELRLKLDSAIAQGKLTVSFMKEDKAETADGVAKDAYIGLFGESTSTSNAIVDLRIQADKFVIRDQADIDVAIPFVPDVWTDVEMTWDASAASDAVAPLVTITINGTSVTTDAFSSASGSLSDVMNGVRYAIFKLGDNGSTIPDAAYMVDNIKLYDDLAGTSVAFEDDFESYEIGDSLDTDNPNSPYNSSTAEAVVEQIGTETEEPGNPDNQVAQITDNMTDDAGELRYKLDAAVAQGKLTVSFFKDDKAETADGVAKDAYIGLYGESTSTSNAIVDLRIQADKFVVRDQDFDVAVPFVPNAWNDVVMTWDATAASDSAAPLVTISINGTSLTTDAFASASGSLSDVMNGVRYAIFKLGDNSSTIPNAAYFVDDVKLYSDLEGTAVAFEDDFEGYTVGDSLDTDNDASPYNSSTAEAVVAKKAK